MAAARLTRCCANFVGLLFPHAGISRGTDKAILSHAVFDPAHGISLSSSDRGFVAGRSPPAAIASTRLGGRDAGFDNRFNMDEAIFVGDVGRVLEWEGG